MRRVWAESSILHIHGQACCWHVRFGVHICFGVDQVRSFFDKTGWFGWSVPRAGALDLQSGPVLVEFRDTDDAVTDGLSRGE
jgi:hypothetical protein